MSATIADPLAWFPYTPRLHQDKAVCFAAEVYSSKTVGLLSADCGVGKTIAVLSGYLAARAGDASSRLFALTRTHSQSRVFEMELDVLRAMMPKLTATTLVSRIHMCPIRSKIDSDTSTGFMRACASMIKTSQCTYFHNVYHKNKNDGRHVIREWVRERVEELLRTGVVTRERVEDLASDEGVCPYEVLRWCARQSKVIIGPYSYMFRSRVREALLSSLGVSLNDADLLIDEAHNLSDHALDSETARLNGADLRWLRDHKSELVKETKINWIGEAVDFLYETMMLNLDGMNRRSERTIAKWDVAPRFINESDLRFMHEITSPNIGDPEVAVTMETPLDRLVEFLFVAHISTRSEGWHVTLNVKRSWDEALTASKATLLIRPLNASGLTAPVLRGARSALLMSGTLRPLDHYARLLGVGSAATQDLASPYPRSTRLVLIDKELTTKYQSRCPDLWRALADRINTVLTSVPANKSALIAFPSYKILHEVLSYGIDSGYRGTLVEERGDRIETVAEALEIGPHAIFSVFGGKFTEGVDLVMGGSSMIDLIIGVGIPFSPPTSYQRALQDFYDTRFGEGAGYHYGALVPSIRQVAQVLGRLRRAPEDWGIVVLLDKRFLKHIRVFGDDMIADIWPFSDVNELKAAISQFIELRESS
ncbi:MAG: ATP-dependent DNA helicase [Candidatus Thorarchaeota archaeon]